MKALIASVLAAIVGIAGVTLASANNEHDGKFHTVMIGTGQTWDQVAASHGWPVLPGSGTDGTLDTRGDYWQRANLVGVSTSDGTILPYGSDVLIPNLPIPTTTTTTTTVPVVTTTTVVPTTTTASTTTTTTATTIPVTSTTSAVTTTTAHEHSFMHVVCPGEQDLTPMGAIAPAKPMLCDQLGDAVDTAANGANSWVDEFNHGATMSELPSSYVQGHVGPGAVSRHFIHQNHWMSDIRSDSGQYPTLAAAWMRPNRTFAKKPDGSVVIEFEVATPIAGTRDVEMLSDSWPEFAISTAPAPRTSNPWGSPFLRNGTYFYEAFAGSNVMGCRIQQSRHPICAYYVADSDGAGAPDRQWELNQNGTDVVPGSEFGGDPSTPGLSNVWSVCSSTDDPDVVCRNLFRWTLTDTTVRLDVKKPGGTFVRYYEATPCNDRAGCATGQMSTILNNPGGFYVYLAGFAYRIENNGVLRTHWDRIAINE